MDKTCYFLHGLESSSQGTKGRWFDEHFPNMIVPDFKGTLEERLTQLDQLCGDGKDLLFVGSSFGGLMATVYASRHPLACRRLILLAPALNYDGYVPSEKPIQVPTLLVIGRHDTVTPPDRVVPLAEKSFADIEIRVEDDDHMLHNMFPALDWSLLLGK
ncbi:alpha/beta fold hydrolase [Desulfogranum marinum]|uniref:alpha/beta fold hydrolase n=1 Tax=Desulfogranum marinum TaxID=453220 RepID=UPI0019654F36|nr:alpha/beta fold hydrolase [Desulfogranum marinum]MBM9514332.1 alpha/beta fold hydrolase [Desulfogranum marinum]